MDETVKLWFGSIIRHGLTVASGATGFDAYVTSDWTTAAVAFVMASGAIAWSFLQKKYFAKMIA